MGVEGVVVPVSATNDKPLQGFSFGTVFPLQHARLAEINLEGTVAEQVGADVFVVEIWNGGPEDPQDALGWGTCSVILDFEPPLEGRVIPPGVGQPIANPVYDILPPSGSVPRSITVRFVGYRGEPPVPVVFYLFAGGRIPPPSPPGPPGPDPTMDPLGCLRGG
ncbi:MAG: hypothetical protein ACUVYA_18095 [Planctomycetota bacterium]